MILLNKRHLLLPLFLFLLLTMQPSSRLMVRNSSSSSIRNVYSCVLFLCVDASLGQFIDVVEGKFQNDYAVIYTSSDAKVRNRILKTLLV